MPCSGRFFYGNLGIQRRNAMGYYVPNFTRLKIRAGLPSVMYEDQLDYYAEKHGFEDYIQDWDGTAPRLGSVSITRDPNSASVEAGTEVTYTARSSGNAETLAYSWTIGGTDSDRTITGGTTSQTCVVTWLTSGRKNVTCEITASDEGVTDSPAEGTIAQNVFVTIGTVTIAGDQAVTAGEERTYTATASGSATDVEFVFSAPGETFDGGTVIWQSAGVRQITCTATSATATQSPVTATLDVVVSARPVVGAVTVTNDDDLDTIQAGVETSFSAVNAGNAEVVSRTWTSTDAGATITPNANGTSADVTFSAAGDFTVTCTMSDGTDSVAGSASMTVTAAPITLTVSSPQLVDGAWDDSVGMNAAVDDIQNPELTWTLANAGTITGYSLLIIDLDASDNNGDPWRHWNVRAQPDGPNGGNGIMEVTETSVTIGRITINDDNNLPGEATPGSTTGGFGLNNGFEPFGPPQEAHTYRVLVQAWNGNTLVATSNELEGTYTPENVPEEPDGPIEVETPPSFTGTLRVGETLTATPATFTNAPESARVLTSFLGGATENGNFFLLTNADTYTLRVTDVNTWIRVQSRLNDISIIDDVTSESDPQGPVQEQGGVDPEGPDIDPPEGGTEIQIETETTIRGTPSAGQIMTATPATFSGDENMTVTGQWVSNDAETNDLGPLAWLPIEEAEENQTDLVIQEDLVGRWIRYNTVATPSTPGVSVVSASDPVQIQ
ncbi:cell wall/surface repeat protein [uncultured phage_MedDCM-OCT-S31-C1]|uniref:Cell wall/surface repeat protein n=1 Tax=uncultured phage_MedDCM-OCT-S31-C1 TaxID=2740800 RepID=A0A6S4P7W4_9CAUD|nr:cell wall/surface repeat protein [uncultured phage_MedDCM-OCT-S31-C1]BAQ94411.1 cell wall/surface repeat protein [uncultured phage_MedDCM-OCT-S31-C1]